MARLIARADGNFTDATTWSPCATAANAELDSEAANTSLTTSAQDSAAFVLPAEEIDAVALKLNTRAVGTPTNTLTVTLRNVTAAADARTVTVNVADLDPCDGTERQGGWYLFKFSAPLTPNGTDSYAIRLLLNNASTAVSFWRDATATNWSRLIRRTATVAPAAADRLLVLREQTGAGAGTNRVVVMNHTATTTFGNATGITTGGVTAGGAVNAAVVVGKGGTLAWETAAAKAYYLKITGSLVVYSSGTLTVGTLAAPIPRSSSAVLEVAQATQGDSKFGFLAGATVSLCGQSRTTGNASVWCLLNTDEAAAQTVLGVDRDTGWLSGDEVVIAPTSRTASESEKRTLASNAASTSLTVSAGLSFAHQGSVALAIQAEVILLSRNVWLRSDNATRYTQIEGRPGVALTCSWVRLQHMGGNTTHVCLLSNTLMEYCAADLFSSGGGYTTSSGTAAAWRLEHCVAYAGAASTPAVMIQGVGASTGWVIDDFVSITGGYGIVNWSPSASMVGASITNVRVSGAVNGGVYLPLNATTLASPTTVVENLTVHSNNTVGINSSLCVPYKTFRNWTAYRNAGGGIVLQAIAGAAFYESTFENLVAFGNANANLAVNPLHGSLVLRNCVAAGESGNTSATGLDVTGVAGGQYDLRLENCTLGGGGGTKTTHTSRDLSLLTAGTMPRVTLVNCSLFSSTRLFNASTLVGNMVSEQRPQGLIAGSYTNWFGRGMTAYNTSIVHAPETSSEHLICGCLGTATLRSSPYRAVVRTGDAPLVTVWVMRTAGYNGTILPRLVVKANPAVGLLADMVLATMSAAPNVWEQLSASGPVPTEAGKLEFAVEVNGSADGAYVGAWTITNATVVGPFYWFDGQPGGELLGESDSGGGEGGGGGETSHLSFG